MYSNFLLNCNNLHIYILYKPKTKYLKQIVSELFQKKVIITIDQSMVLKTDNSMDKIVP